MADQSLTSLEKVAVLLKSLPGDLADKVTRHLEPRHAGLIGVEIAKLKNDAGLDQKAKAVLEEVAGILARPAAAPPPKKEPIAPPPASQVDVRVDDKLGEPAPDPHVGPLGALAALPPDLLARVLDTESARTIAILINCLDIDLAGEIYKRISPPKRKEVSLRFTEQPNVSQDLLKRIVQGVARKCQALQASATTVSTEPGERDKRIASLLRGLERAERAEMLTVLQGSDAELASRVKALLFQFEDILRMENPTIQKLLSEIDVKSLAQALYGAAPEVETKILANLSKRAQTSLKEEAELNGKLSSAVVQQARQSVVQAIQRLDERGDLMFVETA